MESENKSLDKRPWLMDWLFQIGHNMAVINHCYEKIQYLSKEVENAGDDMELVTKLTNKIAAYHEIRAAAYSAYNLEMSYIFSAIPEAQKEDRCLLKHASTDLVLAQETSDSLNNSTGDINLNQVFKVFAGVVSLALDIEFNTCIRCIYDGVAERSLEVKGIKKAEAGKKTKIKID